ISFVSEAEAADAGIAANPKDPAAPPATDEGGGSVLVGYGTGGGATSRRRTPRHAQGPNGRGPVRSAVGVIAKPPIRNRARDLRVDPSEGTASGGGGEGTRDGGGKPAQEASGLRNIGTPAWGGGRGEEPPGTPRGDGGRSESIPGKGGRKATSSAM